MKIGAQGLVEVPESELRALLGHVYRGTLPCPLDVAGLARVGLQHRAEVILHHLRRLDAIAVRSVLVAVIAERAARS